MNRPWAHVSNAGEQRFAASLTDDWITWVDSPSVTDVPARRWGTTPVTKSTGGPGRRYHVARPARMLARAWRLTEPITLDRHPPHRPYGGRSRHPASRPESHVPLPAGTAAGDGIRDLSANHGNGGRFDAPVTTSVSRSSGHPEQLMSQTRVRHSRPLLGIAGRSDTPFPGRTAYVYGHSAGGIDSDRRGCPLTEHGNHRANAPGSIDPVDARGDQR